MTDAHVIFAAQTIGGQAVTVDAPDHDGDTLFTVTDTGRSADFYLAADDVQRLWLALATTNAQARTEWAAQAVYVGGTVKHTVCGDEEDARLTVDAIAEHLATLSDPARRHGCVERAELVSREVHTLADGTTVTGPWTVATNASKDD